MKTSRYEIYIVIFLFLAITVILILRFLNIDHSQTPEWGYVNAGSINPYYGVPRPFGYRLFMPVLLNFLGIVPKPGEPWVPIPAAILLCFTFFVFLKKHGFSTNISVMGTLFLSLSGGITDLLRDFPINNTDTSSHILILLAAMAVIQNNDSLFSLAVMLGVFNREWALVLIPCWYLYYYGLKISGYAVGRLIRIALPSLLVYIMVRVVYFPNTALGGLGDELSAIMPVSETTTLYYYLSEFQKIDCSIFVDRLFSPQFYEFGLIGLVPYALHVFPNVPRRWQRVCIFYSFLCIIQLTFAADVWRLAFYLFPIILTLFILWIRQLESWFDPRTQFLIGGSAILVYLIGGDSIGSFVVAAVLCFGIEWYRNSRTKFTP